MRRHRPERRKKKKPGGPIVAEDMVRVLDLQTQTITTIPARELAPGMVRCQVRGIEGEVWVAASALKPSPIRHPPFPEEVRDLLRELAETFHDVYPRSVDEWEEGFRRDADPNEEIAFWLHLSQRFRQLTLGDQSPEERSDLFRLLLTALSNGKDAVRFTFQAKTLSRERIEQVLAVLFPEKGKHNDQGNAAGK
jgi:hypothetical protein